MTVAKNINADLIFKVGDSMLKEALKSSAPPSLETEGGKSSMTVEILAKTKIGVSLGKSVKALKRHKRTDGDKWLPLIERGTALVSSWKIIAQAEQQNPTKRVSSLVDVCERLGLPKNVSEYKARLIKHKKELYKNPPVMPLPSIPVEGKTYGLPKRDKKTGQFTFAKGLNAEANLKIKDFHPNRSPEEVLRAGSFGGTYFRPIVSGVTNVRYKAKDVLNDTVDPEWITGLDRKTILTSATYRTHVNKYGVKCGGSLGMWEISGWIADCDPYGWFQWYCRFFRGRRCGDDARQISRWLKSAGPKGRFRSQLCNKISAANTRADEASISPVIRQTLLHWGLEITDHVLDAHIKRR